MATVAELGFVGMAIQAGVGQAHIECLALLVDKYALGVAHHRGAPQVEQLHMFGGHVRLGHDAFLGRLGFFRQNRRWCWRRFSGFNGKIVP